MAGRLSYPIYLLHVPVAVAAGFVLKRMIGGMAGFELTSSCVVMTVVASWLALVLYDEPVRRWLTVRLMRRSSPPAESVPGMVAH